MLACREPQALLGACGVEVREGGRGGEESARDGVVGGQRAWAAVALFLSGRSQRLPRWSCAWPTRALVGAPGRRRLLGRGRRGRASLAAEASPRAPSRGENRGGTRCPSAPLQRGAAIGCCAEPSSESQGVGVPPRGPKSRGGARGRQETGEGRAPEGQGRALLERAKHHPSPFGARARAERTAGFGWVVVAACR